tara:strand:- start:5770 stop:5985 length:216 start_codon:yes stop_codon:yes gene_type:complete
VIRVLFNKKGDVFRTLILVLDTQCNSTAYLDALNVPAESTTADLFEQSITFHLYRRPAIESCQATQMDKSR